MNILVYDASRRVARFVRSVIQANGCRVSVSTDAGDARLKLPTGIFDALILGPEGAPRELAEWVEAELPRLPIILAGTPSDAPCAGPVVAVLPAPLEAGRLARALRRVEQGRRRQMEALPISVEAEGISIACRLADLTPETMVLSGESDEFRRVFCAGARRVEARVWGIFLGGEARGRDGGDFRRVQRVDVQLESGNARDVLIHLLK